MSHTLCKVKDIPERCSMIELTYLHRSDWYCVSIPVSDLDHRALFSTIFKFSYTITFYRRIFVCHSCLKIMPLIDMSETASVPPSTLLRTTTTLELNLTVAFEFLCIYILTTREKQFQKEFYSIVSGWRWWKKKNRWKAKTPVYSSPPTYTIIVFPRNIA